VNGERVHVKVKDLRRTAMATPFAAALGCDPNTVIAYVVDLSNPNGVKDLDARMEKAVQHGIDAPKLLVGAKADLPRELHFTEMASAARSRGIPYVEVVALGDPEACPPPPGVQAMLSLALSLAAGLDELHGVPQGGADRAENRGHSPEPSHISQPPPLSCNHSFVPSLNSTPFPDMPQKQRPRFISPDFLAELKVHGLWRVRGGDDTYCLGDFPL
jgi:hypothetical protein